jgi:cell division protein ZapC
VLNHENNGSNWQWFIDPDTDELQLELSSNIRFGTQFKSSELINSDLNHKGFSTSDAFVYSLYRDKFKDLPIDEEQAFTLAVSATISVQYLKPLATKSWYFSLAHNDLNLPIKQGDWVVLNAQSEAIYLVLDASEHASNIMLMSKIHYIDDNKTFSKGKTLRVHNDRMLPILYELQEHQL